MHRAFHSVHGMETVDIHARISEKACNQTASTTCGNTGEDQCHAGESDCPCLIQVHHVLLQTNRCSRSGNNAVFGTVVDEVCCYLSVSVRSIPCLEQCVLGMLCDFGGPWRFKGTAAQAEHFADDLGDASAQAVAGGEKFVTTFIRKQGSDPRIALNVRSKHHRFGELRAPATSDKSAVGAQVALAIRSAKSHDNFLVSLVHVGHGEEAGTGGW